MCNYVKENMCSITNDVCPWMYLCLKDSKWKPNNYMPQKCNIIEQLTVPKGYYKVRMIKSKWLYVDLGDRTIKVENTLSYAPQFVKLIKRNGEYKVKKEKQENEGN